MTYPNFLRALALVLLVSAISSCKSSQVINFNQNDSGVYLAQKSTIPKGAVRVTIELTSELTLGDGEYYAEAKVLDVHMFGETFATAKPRKGDAVRLSITEDIEGKEFKKGDKVMLDALTPILKTGELLDITML